MSPVNSTNVSPVRRNTANDNWKRRSCSVDSSPLTMLSVFKNRSIINNVTLDMRGEPVPKYNPYASPINIPQVSLNNRWDGERD